MAPTSPSLSTVVSSVLRHHHYLLLSLVLLLLSPLTHAGGGKWDLLLSNIGISAMHMQLLHTDRVVIFDRTDAGSNISLPNGKCIGKPPKVDCKAHSVEYDVASNSIRALTVLTNVWCSAAAVMPDGTLVQTGGFYLGSRGVRFYAPCTNRSCDWQEVSSGMAQSRWYSTNHILPDGRVIVVGGRRQFNYEFFPKKSATEASYTLPFLAQTNDPGAENNLYPFVIMNSDGNLFIFANNRAILLNYSTGSVVKSYPTIPGGDPRNYPSTGSAVLLPLKNNELEVLVCGGAPNGSYMRATKGSFLRALDSCGRIRLNDPNPEWVMEIMPWSRAMGDMVLLPDGSVLIVNGVGLGTAGWELGREPVLSPVIYRPDNPTGSRFDVQNPSSRPRVYHSSAIVLRSGQVLVGGTILMHFTDSGEYYFPLI